MLTNDEVPGAPSLQVCRADIWLPIPYTQFSADFDVHRRRCVFYMDSTRVILKCMQFLRIRL